VNTRTSRATVETVEHTERPDVAQPPEPPPHVEPRGLRARLRDLTAAVGAAHREGVPF
jgi:hypothetical protein